jgi:hypothetical protein
MNLIQKLRNLIFGKSKVVETPAPVEVKPTVKEMVAAQEAPAPKPKRKYYKKKKSKGESK